MGIRVVVHVSEKMLLPDLSRIRIMFLISKEFTRGFRMLAVYTRINNQSEVFCDLSECRLNDKHITRRLRNVMPHMLRIVMW